MWCFCSPSPSRSFFPASCSGCPSTSSPNRSAASSRRPGPATSVQIERGATSGSYFYLLVNFFTAARNSSPCMQAMIASRSASSCSSTGLGRRAVDQGLGGGEPRRHVVRQPLRETAGRGRQLEARHHLGDE